MRRAATSRSRSPRMVSASRSPRSRRLHDGSHWALAGCPLLSGSRPGGSALLAPRERRLGVGEAPEHLHGPRQGLLLRRRQLAGDRAGEPALAMRAIPLERPATLAAQLD